MSRYIDADALDRAFSKLRFNNDGELEHYGDRPNWYLWGSEIESLIATAPSIDIVRCKECRHKYQEPWHNGVKVEGECEIWHNATLDDNYCSYGEREGE